MTDRTEHRSIEGDAGGGASPGRWIVPALMVVVALPSVVAGARLAANGWVPTTDDGFLVARARDWFSLDPPLVGQYSMAGEGSGPAAHSLGPTLYWLLAPVVLLPSWVLPVWMGVVNGACLAGSVGLAARRGGRWFALATALGLLLLFRSLGPVAFAEVWNPWAALAPMVLLAFAAWSVADGERTWLPLVVLLASFAAQAHLTYVAAAVGLGVVALVGGWGPGLVARLRGRPDDDAAPAVSWVGDRQISPIGLSVVVGLVCWAPVVIEQLTGDPGNLTLAREAAGADRSRIGSDAVLASVARSVGLVPTFTLPRATPSEAIERALDAGPFTVVGGAIALVLLVAVAVLAIVQRDRTVIAGAAVAGTLVASVAFVAGSLPADRVLVAAYGFRWFAIAGLLVWLVVGLGIGRQVVRRWRRAGSAAPDGEGDATARADREGRPRWAGAATGAALAVVPVGAWALAAPFDDPADWTYDASVTLSDAALGATEPSGRYLLADAGPYGVSLLPAIAYELRASDREVVLTGNATEAFGDRYRQDGTACDGELLLLRQDQPVPEGATELAALVLPDDAPVTPEVRLVFVAKADRAPDRPTC